MLDNVGTLDKTFRIIAGIIIIAVGIYYKSWWGLIGLIPLATGFFRSCLLYKPFGLNTTKTKMTEE
ncbi:DUF2892 domain-containing protein [candidate division KSB1 bacterium]